ncbi:unnamed protein product [Discosporangium mesarthrocarpum]
MTVTGPRRAGTRRRFSLALPLVGMLLSWKTSVASGYDRSQREEEYFGSRLQQRELGHNLYQDPHQQQGGMMKYVGMAALGMVVEFLWTNRSLKKMKKQFDQEMTVNRSFSLFSRDPRFFSSMSLVLRSIVTLVLCLGVFIGLRGLG